MRSAITLIEVVILFAIIAIIAAIAIPNLLAHKAEVDAAKPLPRFTIEDSNGFFSIVTDTKTGQQWLMYFRTSDSVAVSFAPMNPTVPNPNLEK